jgi:hypothetical protein
MSTRLFLAAPLTLYCAFAGAQIHIEAGPARTTLTEWARQSGYQLLFDYAVATETTHAVSDDGSADSEQLLWSMLVGTHLHPTWVNEFTLAVHWEEALLTHQPVVWCTPELGARAALPPCHMRLKPLLIAGDAT